MKLQEFKVKKKKNKKKTNQKKKPTKLKTKQNNKSMYAVSAVSLKFPWKSLLIYWHATKDIHDTLLSRFSSPSSPTFAATEG